MGGRKIKVSIYNYLLSLVLIISSPVQAEFAMGFGEFEDLPEFDEFLVPVVLTATRIQQHQADVPASVTILDSELIKQLGVKSLSELLRHVPGMMVGPDNNNNSDAVHYHGGPAALPKNLQVLINGRSMYRSGLAAVSWFEMPVALEDIRRIEVVRGPNASSYGANAYQAVINILTKHPADTYGTSVSYSGGNNGEDDIYLRQGGKIGETDYRVSFTQKSDDGFDDQDDTRIAKFVDFESHRQLGGGGELETSVVVLKAKKGLADSTDFQVNENAIDEDRVELGLRWTLDISNKHQLSVKSYVTQYNQKQTIDVAGVYSFLLDDDLRELYASSPDSADSLVAAVTVALETADLTGIPVAIGAMPTEVQTMAISIVNKYPGASAAAPVNGTINADMDEYRFDVEIQDTFVYSPSLTFVSGASFRRDVVKSETYFSGEANNNTSRLFGSVTWQTTTNISTHLGLMFEKENNADFVYAPRVAFNYKITPSQSFRAVYSESVRSPDLFEQQAYWSYNLDGAQIDSAQGTLNGTTFYQTQTGPNNLDHQFIESYELGYYGRVPFMGLETDVRIFHEHQADVFYQSLRLSALTTEEDISVRFEGVEWMLNITPWHNGKFRWNAAVLNAFSNAEDTGTEQVILKIYARNTTTFSWLQSWPFGFSSTFSYLKADKYDQLHENNEVHYLFERLDARLAKISNISSYELELSVSLQYDLSSDPYISNNNVYEEETRFQIGARMSF